MTGRRRKRRIDQALCDRARHLAEYYPLKQVAAALDLHPSQITLIKRRGWKPTEKEGAPERVPPPDLAERQAVMTFAELCAYYQAGTSTVARWLRNLPGRRPHWRGGGPAKDKPAEELAAIRARQWETRRARYGQSGLRRRVGKARGAVD